MFSKFFASIFTVSSDFVPVEEVEVENPLLDFDVSQSKIRSICEILDATKAVGPDGIPPILFKICAKTISKSMASVFYKIKQTGVFPVCWKSSIVSLTFKKGSKANLENYRQISLLCIISKIFEKTLFDSLNRYTSPYFSDSQFGFRKQRSCITQLLIYLEKIYNSLDSDDEIDVIYTDYEKAFDNVDHGILLQKLYKIGIRGSF